MINNTIKVKEDNGLASNSEVHHLSYRSIKLFRMHHKLWIAVLLAILVGNVNSRLTKHVRPENETIENHRRKLIQADDEYGISGSYIVHFKDDVSDEAVEQAAEKLAVQTGGNLLWIYKAIFKGFAISGLDSDDHLASILGHDDVEIMEQDIRFHLDDQEFFPEGADMNYEQVGDDVPNGLDRIDQEDLPLDKVYRYNEFGRNVTVYVLDTGISMDHVDFQGRATCGLDLFPQNSTNDADFVATPDTGNLPPICDDTFNHGTPITAIIGGMLSGVAKQTTLVSVKVIGTNGGTAATVLAGLEYVGLQKLAFPTKPMVVNMSLGSKYTKSVNQGVNRLVDSGVSVVVSAGNRHTNACLSTPASATRAITVGASTTTIRIFENRDRRAFYSNWGQCVDIFAPGTRIRTASAVNQTRYGIITGTSAAAPHVTGVIARYLERDPTMTPDQIREKLMNDALDGHLMTIFQMFSPNKLLHIEPEP